ncbi:hypothetical protein K431DRAFT_215523 [Polychaeton citri CBS 116435]|uniref:Translation initiation factor eIF2B subunit gamma n=1 Tax=Polychaeton citri CBS 116435 TaxID=1314669 RepID=A0A9P4URH0_9PEZI|nr:hypothetical protein K431DRAFT_215523 [Polychaeton citri CBS 116435]
MPHATMPSPGLQALIFCGPGVSLNSFTSSPKDLPKSLVPIANRPMVWYPLDWCYRMGINGITLITPAESAGSLEASLATNPALTSLPNPKPEILAPKALTQTTGTAEILTLPEVQKAITSDFIILPCDLISELDGSSLVQQWMNLNDLTLSSKNSKRKGGMSMFYPTQGLEGISHKKDETDFIGTIKLPPSPVPSPKGSLRPAIESLVMSMPTDTLKDITEEDKDKSLKIRTTLLNTFGNVKLRMKHRDAHVYIFPKWVKDYAAKNDTFESISEDLVGWWAKAGWQEGLRSKLKLDEVLRSGKLREMDESMDDFEDEIDAAAKSSTRTSQLVQAASDEGTSFASRVGSTAESSPRTDTPPMLAYVQPALSTSNPSQPLIRRVDNSHQLLNVSLHLAKKLFPQSLAHEHKIHPTASIGQQSRISQEDSLIAENVKVGTRVNIKESVIGANCEIGNNARLTRCLLMEGVQVGEGVQLTGCIIGRRARIEGLKPVDSAHPPAEGAEAGKEVPGRKGKKRAGAGDEEDRTKLTECEVAPQYVVEAGTELKGEKLMSFDTEGMSDEDFLDEDGIDDDEGMAFG